MPLSENIFDNSSRGVSASSRPWHPLERFSHRCSVCGKCGSLSFARLDDGTYLYRVTHGDAKHTRGIPRDVKICSWSSPLSPELLRILGPLAVRHASRRDGPRFNEHP